MTGQLPFRYRVTVDWQAESSPYRMIGCAFHALDVGGQPP